LPGAGSDVHQGSGRKVGGIVLLHPVGEERAIGLQASPDIQDSQCVPGNERDPFFENLAAGS
jgi:hypothetical protein